MGHRIAALLLVAVPALSGARDISPGTWEISGASEFAYSAGDRQSPGLPSYRSTTFGIHASALTYVATNIGIGFSASGSRTTWDFRNTPFISAPSGTETSFVIGPALTLSVSISDALSLIAGGGVGYAVAEQPGYSANGYAFTVGAGLRHFLVRSVSLDGTVVYQRTSVGGGVRNDGFVLGLGFSVYLGGSSLARSEPVDREAG